MNEKARRWCVLIPCSSAETWAVPLNCLGEILTVHTESVAPPARLDWRGETLQVMDFGADEGAPWRDPSRGAGLVAVFLGLRGEGCAYWGIAVRGEGLRVVDLADEALEDVPEQLSDHAAAAFRFNGVLCQVPDLDGFQKQIAVNR